jgi:hypothetical protein
MPAQCSHWTPTLLSYRTCRMRLSQEETVLFGILYGYANFQVCPTIRDLSVNDQNRDYRNQSGVKFPIELDARVWRHLRPHSCVSS